MECDLESSPSGVTQKSKKNKVTKIKTNLKKINNVHLKNLAKINFILIGKHKKRLKNNHNIQGYKNKLFKFYN